MGYLLEWGGVERVSNSLIAASNWWAVANWDSLVRNKRHAAHVSKAGVTGHNTAETTGTGTPCKYGGGYGAQYSWANWNYGWSYDG